MSDKKTKSASHLYRESVYLKPCDKVFIEAYTKVHSESKSTFASNAIHEYIQGIPDDIRKQILHRAKENE
jgi:diphthamide biosynthesis methyltransferase